MTDSIEHPSRCLGYQHQAELCCLAGSRLCMKAQRVSPQKEVLVSIFQMSFDRGIGPNSLLQAPNSSQQSPIVPVPLGRLLLPRLK